LEKFISQGYLFLNCDDQKMLIICMLGTGSSLYRKQETFSKTTTQTRDIAMAFRYLTFNDLTAVQRLKCWKKTTFNPSGSWQRQE